MTNGKILQKEDRNTSFFYGKSCHCSYGNSFGRWLGAWQALALSENSSIKRERTCGESTGVLLLKIEYFVEKADYFRTPSTRL